MENDGGNAFPADQSSCGMSLRDYFAAKALSGLLVENLEPDINRLAEAAYDLADAMLRARVRSPKDNLPGRR